MFFVSRMGSKVGKALATRLNLAKNCNHKFFDYMLTTSH